MEREISIVDTTLRDGLQCPGTAIGLPERLQIAQALVDAGITCIEAGTPASGEVDQACISRLTETYKRCRIIAWCRSRQSDLMSALTAGARAVHLSFPASDHLLQVLNKPPGWIYNQLRKLIPEALQRFPWVSAGFMDASRTPFPRLGRLVEFAIKLGASAIRIADTLGLLTPQATMLLVRRLSDKMPLSLLEFHAHNDLGMATANAISAVEAGAGAVSVTVNGIGERAGNAALEQVVVALYQCLDVRSSIQLSRLQDLCEAVAGVTRIPIPRDRPITGADIFVHQSGIHCHGLLRNPLSYAPYDPVTTGHSPNSMVAGPYSGRATVIGMVGQRFGDMDAHRAHSVLNRARHRALKLRRCLSVEEIVAIASDMESEGT